MIRPSHNLCVFASSRELLVLAALIACALLIVCAALFTRPGLYSRWSTVKDGMTQAQVSQLLGAPLSTGPGGCTGAGGKPVTRWSYRVNLVWRIVDYYVDFDYIGPAGAPVVFRAERLCSDFHPSYLWAPRARY